LFGLQKYGHAVVVVLQGSLDRLSNLQTIKKGGP
jgi:hypothetical protein